MKVTTSCSGRFHIFDQARELQRHEVLHRFVNDYPKWMTRRWDIPDDKVVSLLANGLLGRMTRVIPDSWTSFKSSVVEQAHDWFSRRLAYHVPSDSDVFIGLSSFCLQAIQRAKACGQAAVVDHGSLHQRTERELLEEEGRLHGLTVGTEVAPAWIIDKEEREFHIADRVMVLSEAARRSFTAEGVANEKIFVNPCGVDLAQFMPAAQAEGDNVFRIIYCGNISLRKGVHYLFQAFTELRLDKAELWLIGAAPDRSFNRLLASRSFAGIRFLGTFPQRELHRLYGQGSVFVLPSLADGFGLVVPQAMACGLPVIVTRNVGAADLVTEGVDGFVVPIRDVAMLKEKIHFLYEQPDVRNRMSRAAAQNAKNRLGWDAYGDRLVAWLGGLGVGRPGDICGTPSVFA